MTRQHRRRRRHAGLLTLVLGVLVAGPLVPAASAAPSASDSPTSWVRAAHLIPGLGTMTIALVPFAGSSAEAPAPGDVPAATRKNGALLLASTAGYGTVGGYRQVAPGTYAVTVRPAGAAPDSTPLLTGLFEARSDGAATLAAIGAKSSPRFETLRDDLTPPEPGSASVRVVPAGPDFAGTTLVADDGPTLVEDAAFGRGSGYTGVPAGPWDLEVRATTSDGREVGPTTRSVEVASGSVYTVFVLADGSDGIALKAVLDADGVDAAPRGGPQTGVGGAAVRPAGPGVLAGLGLAGCGLVALVALGAGARPRPVSSPGR